MRLPPLHEARFVRRLNRFAATVSLNGREVMVHVANSGRLRELLQPGSLCYLTDQPGSHRKTAYDLSLVAIDRPRGDGVREPAAAYGTERGPAQDSLLVSADARLPNALVWEAWRDGTLPHFEGYPSARREVRYHDSRLDMLLESPAGQCYVEVKSVTLVQDGVARFPDAPTDRGRRHVPRWCAPSRRATAPRPSSSFSAPTPSASRPTTPTTRSSAQPFERPSPLAWKRTPSPAP